jgi:hypothetical protein
MWWRLPRSAFDAAKGETNHEAFRKIVADGAVPGLLLYADDQPVGGVRWRRGNSSPCPAGHMRYH